MAIGVQALPPPPKKLSRNGSHLMFERNKLVPELMVCDLAISLGFWVSCLGFKVAYQRPEDGFAYLDLNGAQVMLEQVDSAAGQWLTAPLEKLLEEALTYRSMSKQCPLSFKNLFRPDARSTETAKTPGIGLTM
jgi:hypothetical protein